MLPYSPLMLILSIVTLVIICFIINKIFSKVFKAPANVESLYITALILALIITPPSSLQDISYLIFIFWAAVWAMASKYIFAIGKKHIFNPAAFAVVITAFTINQSASWWIGTASMMPFVLIGGLLITRKIRRFDLVFSFIIVSLLATILMHAHNFTDIFKFAYNAVVASPLLFFAFVMLTEPLTTPPTKYLRMSYGALVGAIFDPVTHLGFIYSTPELALIVGNFFSYLVSPKIKLLLKLKQKTQIANDTYDFAFASNKDEVPFRPGQYMEWTLAHRHPDSRGNRRYFTVSSSPIDEQLHIGVKFYPKASSFKKALFNMQPNDTIVASQIAGDFTMPRNKNMRLCFIAGGIGVTPFESMISYMLARKQKRNVVMFYMNKTPADIAYKDVFEKARTEIGINTIYALSDQTSVPKDWNGLVGNLTGEMIVKTMPDYENRMYYISGPRAMVVTFEDILSKMGIPQTQIKKDFFPGFA
ncbi:MAG TPA: RnfABCDGE type electron transport complex subunit D [Candidatus Paceibacterota bacterium]|nr:RnfABCDGE type electron transport complex subunit D [Candidatus Paceibacterota bacterium]